MKRLVPAVLTVGLAASAIAFAQDAVVGKYRGSITATNNFVIGVTLAVGSVEDGRLKGIGTLSAGSCSGDYPFEGSIKGNQVLLRSIASPRGNCVLAFAGTLDGSRLVGKMGNFEVVLSR